MEFTPLNIFPSSANTFKAEKTAGFDGFDISSSEEACDSMEGMFITNKKLTKNYSQNPDQLESHMETQTPRAANLTVQRKAPAKSFMS